MGLVGRPEQESGATGIEKLEKWQQTGGDQRDRAAQKVFARAGSRKPRSDQHQKCSTTDNRGYGRLGGAGPTTSFVVGARGGSDRRWSTVPDRPARPGAAIWIGDRGLSRQIARSQPNRSAPFTSWISRTRVTKRGVNPTAGRCGRKKPRPRPSPGAEPQRALGAPIPRSQPGDKGDNGAHRGRGTEGSKPSPSRGESDEIRLGPHPRPPPRPAYACDTGPN
jgi:hypothetical protein